MSGISRLSLQDVRCFAEPQEVELGKVTLLVGENNTGKSTFLGCYAAFARLASFCDLRDPSTGRSGTFDQPPYDLGDFSTIARDGAEAFVLDGTFDARLQTRVRFAFGARQGHPSERSAEIHFRDSSGTSRRLAVDREPGPPETWRFDADDFSFAIRQAELCYREISTWLSEAVRRGRLPFEGDPTTYRKRLQAAADAKRQALFARLTNFLRTMPFDAEPIAVESLPPDLPPRTWRYPESPLGTVGAEPLRSALSRNGARLGLFSSIDIRQDPGTQSFEVRIMQSERWRNLVHVGYGVHAILGLLRAMDDNLPPTVILLQQPEVHLHPSAQAELAQMMAESPHRFVIETHSDHLIDRFRICVMQGVLPPEALRIAYFQRNPDHNESKIHNICVDRDGNLAGEPPEYGTFFMQETNRLLGVD